MYNQWYYKEQFLRRSSYIKLIFVKCILHFIILISNVLQKSQVTQGLEIHVNYTKNNFFIIYLTTLLD